MTDFNTDSYFDAENGVYRWKSNDQIPFDDMLEENGIPADVRAKCVEVRDAELSAFVAEYKKARANRTPEQIAEEEFEMRAAFGPGERVVNVLTGETTVTGGRKPTKKEQAITIYGDIAGRGHGRKITIQRFMDVLGMSKATASTYYQNIKSGKWA